MAIEALETVTAAFEGIHPRQRRRIRTIGQGTEAFAFRALELGKENVKCRQRRTACLGSIVGTRLEPPHRAPTVSEADALLARAGLAVVEVYGRPIRLIRRPFRV